MTNDAQFHERFKVFSGNLNQIGSENAGVANFERLTNKTLNPTYNEPTAFSPLKKYIYREENNRIITRQWKVAIESTIPLLY